MTRSVPLLQFSLVWSDEDFHEIVVHAASKHYSGTTSVYVAPGEMRALAATLAGFPAIPKERREFLLGQKGLSDHGEVRVLLFCLDATGHIGVHVEMRSQAFQAGHLPESCSVMFCVVLSDIDRFVDELRGLNEEGGVASLMSGA